MRVLLTDEFHIHSRNFASLFEFLSDEKIQFRYLLPKDHPHFPLITMCGKYHEGDRQLALFLRVLERLGDDELFDYAVEGINLFVCARSELLCYFLSLDGWADGEPLCNDDRAVFARMLASSRRQTLLGMAAAWFWIDHWYNSRVEIVQNHFCVVFSGSYIYGRTLLEFLRRSRVRAMVIESCFTGNEYFCEERYTPLANASVIRFPNYRRSLRALAAADASTTFDRETVKAFNKIVSMKNKNVTQPPPGSLPAEFARKPIVLVLGQVVNDFSIIDGGGRYLTSIDLYRRTIGGILAETDCNVILKTHPWERRKVHLKGPFTYEQMTAFRQSLPHDQARRFLILDDFNLGQLLATASFVVTLCSQSGLEAAQAGLKPVVLGSAFYGRAGFTTDHDEPEDFVSDLARGAVSGTLSLDEYRAFCEFVTLLLQYHTPAAYSSGKRLLKRLFTGYAPIPHPESVRSELTLQPTWCDVPADVVGATLKPRVPLTREVCKEELGRQIDLVLQQPTEGGIVVASGAMQPLNLLINNRSDFVLPARHAADFRLNFSYHLRDEEGRVVVWNGRRTRLSADVESFHRQQVNIEAPPAPGRYTLQPALVLEGVAWLNSSQAIAIEVTAANGAATGIAAAVTATTEGDRQP